MILLATVISNAFDEKKGIKICLIQTNGWLIYIKWSLYIKDLVVKS